MRMVDPIMQEFDQEAPTTRRVLERVPLEKKDWKPHPRSMSLGQLPSWMANAPGWTAGVVYTDSCPAMSWSGHRPPRGPN